MSLPNYLIVQRTFAAPKFPPRVLWSQENESAAKYYTVDKRFLSTSRAAIVGLGVRQFNMWKPSIVLFVIGSPFLLWWGIRGMWLLLAICGPILAAAMLAWLTVMVGFHIRLASRLAMIGREYAVALEEDGLVWKTPDNVYEALFSEIARVYVVNDVAVLKLRGSRALCVVPNSSWSAARGLETNPSRF